MATIPRITSYRNARAYSCGSRCVQFTLFLRHLKLRCSLRLKHAHRSSAIGITWTTRTCRPRIRGDTRLCFRWLATQQNGRKKGTRALRHPLCRPRMPTTSSTFAIPMASREPMLCSALHYSPASYSGKLQTSRTQSIGVIDPIANRGFRQHHIVFLHGVTQRAMRCTLANLTVDWFESEPNPPNGSVLIMRRSSDRDSGQRWSEQWCAVCLDVCSSRIHSIPSG